MVYLLFAIAGVMSVLTAFILNSMSPETKHRKIKQFILVAISIILFIVVAIYLLQQTSYN